jgi:hypothetical protein
MYKMTLRGLFGAALLGWVLGLGCGEGGGDRPKTYSVSGTVTYNGEAVEGATVAFQPAAGGQGAFGVTDAAGRYSLTTFSSGDGAVPGQYKVKIVKHKGGEGAAVDQDSPEYEDPAMGGAAGPDAGQRESLLPAKYADASTSGLTATVGESDNSVNFELVD